MTLKELLKETYSLGFEEGEELTEGFIYAASRALIKIVSELGGDSVADITVQQRSHRLIGEKIPLEAGEKFSAELTGEGYSFTASGRGRYTVSSSSGTVSGTFCGECVPVRGFTEGSAVLTVTADSGCCLWGVACFPYVPSDNEADIPLFGDKRKIYLPSLIPDFYRASGVPTGEGGVPVCSVYLTGDTLYTDADFCGKLTLTYRRYPERISIDRKDSPIDIPRELETLLPLLTASYVWLDDNPERSQYYLELYLNEAASIKRSYPSFGGGFRNVTGWA